MIAPRRLAPLPLLLAGLAVLTLVIALTVHAQSQEVPPTAAATGTNPPAKPTNLQVSAVHDSVTLSWTASTDQTVTHYAILRRNPDVDASGVFHVIESNAGPGTSYSDGTVSASSTYIYRAKSVSPTGVSQWSGYVKAETPAAPTPTPTPTPTLTPTPEPEPESTADDQAPTNLAAALAEGGGVTLTWTAPSDDAEGVTGYEVLRAVGQGDSTILVADTGTNATSYTDATATDAGETYAYQVKAIRGDDRSQASGQARVQVPHNPVDLAPSNLTAALADGGGVNLSWSAPAEDADSVTGYEILRAVGEGDMATLVDDTGNTATAYTDTTATEAGETYAYKVKAIRGEDRSQASGQARVQVPHDPEDLRPTGLTVGLVENKVTLSWTAPAEDAESVDGYEILRRRPMEGESTLATLVADTESTATTYTDATANEPGVRYVYRIKALRGDDVSLWSNFDKIELPADYVPDPTPTPEPESTSDDQAPTGLSAALTDGGGVALSWTAPSEDAESVTGYEILRAVGEGEMATLAADTASTDTTYTDTTATEAGETYAYQVKAIRGADRSEASGQAQVQIPHAPDDLAPTGLTALTLFVSLEGNISYSVHLSWTAPAEDVDSITGYEILRAVGEGALATLVDDTWNTTTSYRDATATQTGETYAYTVKAIRGGDRSQASGQARVQLPHDAVDLAPSDLTAEAVDGGGVSLSWSAPAEDAGSVTGYEVLRAVGEGDMATLVADTASTTTTYTDATATEAGETYAYRVKAIRGEARSQGSNMVSLVPVEPPATPENLAPSNLTFEIREDGVTLAWDAPAADADSVTGYRVVRRRPNQGENEWLVWKWDTGSTETAYRDGYAQTHGEFYMYRVRALRGDDYSKMSNRVDVRRPQATPQTAEWAPSNLQAQMYFEVALGEDGVTTQVKLTWDAPAEGAEWVRGYEVQRATCDDDFATLVSDTGSTATAYADATAEAGESYTYRVRARRPQGLSLASNQWTLLLPGGNGESDCAEPLGAPETEPVGEEDLTYALSQHEVPGQEFNTLNAAGNINPRGIWSNGTTMWVVNDPDEFGDTNTKIYAYNLATKAREATNDFNTLMAAGNHNPRGLWSDGTTMWVADWGQNKIFAYDMATKARVSGKDFDALYHENDDDSGPIGIWSDGDTIWVAHDALEWRIHAYDLDDKSRLPNSSINLYNSGNRHATDIWADDTTIFVGDRDDDRIYAYWPSNTAPNPDRFISLSAANERSDGIWSDGDTIWVSDLDDGKIYTYALPDLVPRPAGPVTVRHITDSSAIVRVDVQDFVDYSVMISITINRGGYSIYKHPDASAAFFMLRGLEPETEYTVVGSYGHGPRRPLGEVTFTTPHAQLDGIEISGLTHTSATVTASLLGADSRHYLNYWVSQDRSEPEHTYYLRYKRESDSAFDGWSVPVGLTFSGSTDVPLSELDPGTVYDLQVYEDRFDFPRTSPALRRGVFKKGTWLEQFGAFTTPTMPPTLAFDAEMTVGVGSSSDGYNSSQGSLSPGTFDVGSVQFTVDTVGFDTNDNEFELRVDPALPFDSFTLTLGDTELSVGSTEERVLVKNTGQTIGTNSLTLISTGSTKRAQAFTTGGTISGYTLSSIGMFIK